MKDTMKHIFLLFFLTFSSIFYSEGEHKIFNLGDFLLESGVVLPEAKLSYVTHGKLNEEKNNLSLYLQPILETIMDLTS